MSTRRDHGRGRGASSQQAAGLRWATAAAVVGVLVTVAWMTAEAPSLTPPVLRGSADAGLDASLAAAHGSAETERPAPDGGVDVEDLDGGLTLAPGLLDAALPGATSGPRTVKIGVVLVAFVGAEGASSTARNKRDAATVAERLGQEARTDFHHAVIEGDSGSADDIGRIPRGVLDPRTELAVFALAPGEVSDVLETPKGFWIVKRLD